MQIRRFQIGDGEAVKKLITGIMDSEFSEDKPAFSPADLEKLQNSYGGLGEAFFVAEDKGAIVGTVGVKREDERVALIRRIFVAPAYRKKGIGSLLLNRAMQFCHEVGYRELVFRTTSRMGGAMELFKKEGFQSRAKIPIGQLELLKFVYSVKGKV